MKTLILNRFRTWGWERQIMMPVLALAILPVFALWLRPGTETLRSELSEPAVDTLIPHGFVLVPIEIQNYDSLDSILGRFGVVDLFQNQRLVARNVRILRAPQNPTHFAVLIREDQVPHVLKDGGLFTVIVKRPGPDGTHFVKPVERKRKKIIYEGD